MQFPDREPTRALPLFRISAGVFLAGTCLLLGGRPGRGEQPGGLLLRSRRPGFPHTAARAALPEEQLPFGPRSSAAVVFQRDTVVSNTDPLLNRTDQEDDAECGIAIDPRNPNRIAVSSFSGYSTGHNGRAPIFYSTDGGGTWTKYYNLIQPPPGHPVPNDQTFDFGRSGALFGALLSVDDAGSGTSALNFFTGSTPDPAAPNGWQYWLENGAAQPSHHLGALNSVDQPWLLVGRDVQDPSQDNVYVAYDDYGPGNSDAASPSGPHRDNSGWVIRVAAAYHVGSGPPDFTADGVVANTPAEVHPGQRLAVDPQSGALYSFYERQLNTVVHGDVYTVNYMVNRSLDGGHTWGFGGAAEGVPAATAANYQSKKLGGVNLPGNEHSGAIDPNAGDIYYAFGDRDPRPPHRLRLQVARLAVSGSGAVKRVSSRYVTRAHVAMPQVAVAQNGTVGVFYYTWDGSGARGLPKFSAHLAISRNQGLTWQDTTLLSFLSVVKNDGDPVQRILGDYQQLKAVGNTFYGAYTANGISFGRPFANGDPIFYRVTVP